MAFSYPAVLGRSQQQVSSTDLLDEDSSLVKEVSIPYFSELGSAMSVPDREADENSLFSGEMLSSPRKNGSLVSAFIIGYT
jgi:hypothetical protein